MCFFTKAVLMNSNYTIFMLVMRAVFLAVMITTFAIFLKKQNVTAP